MAAHSIARSESPTLCSNLILPSSQNLADSQVPGDVPVIPLLPAAERERTDDAALPQAPSIMDDSSAVVQDSEPMQNPVSPKVSIVLLLVSGRRTLDFEPKVTIGELKEVVWSTWPADWSDELPPSSAFLRILYLGRILTDETTLSSLNLPEAPETTVVHVSVRSFAPASEGEDLKKKPKKRGSRRGRGSPAEAGNVEDSREDGDAEDQGAGGCCGCIIC